MTMQEVFDKVWEYFVVQKNPPGVLPDSNPPACVYFKQQPDGTKLKCAIGCLLPEQIAARLEGTITITGIISLAESASRNPDGYQSVRPELHMAREFFDGLDAEKLRGLQFAHDEAVCCRGKAFHDAIETNLRNFATRYHLVVPAAA